MKRLILVLCLIGFSFGSTQAAPPFDPDRQTLYTPADLWKGYDSVPEKNESLDWEIFNYFNGRAKYAPPLDELRQQRRHDAGIEHAVNQLLGHDPTEPDSRTGAPYGKRVVVIMGSHSKYRDDPRYGRWRGWRMSSVKADSSLCRAADPG
jgi:hypothetical protein